MSSAKLLTIMLGLIPFGASLSEGAVIVDKENHNGDFWYVDDSYQGAGADGIFDIGFWDVSNPPPANRVPTPTGWTFTGWYSVYQMSSAAIQLRAGLGGEDAYVWNNTGELAESNMNYTVGADLGGHNGARASVSLRATQNADGTGIVIPLATVTRDGNFDVESYALTEVSATSAATTSAVDGYYLQVMVNTDLVSPATDEGLNGFYGEIRVSAEQAVPEPAAMGLLLGGGAFLASSRRRRGVTVSSRR